MTFNLETDLKPGDQVKCIDDSTWALKKGHVYTFTEYSDLREGCLRVAGIEGGWFCSRFELWSRSENGITTIVSNEEKPKKEIDYLKITREVVGGY